MRDVQVANCIVLSTNMHGCIVFERLTEFKFIRDLHKIVHTTTELMVSRISFAGGSVSVRTSRDSKNWCAEEHSNYTKLKRKFLLIFASLC